MVPGKYDPMAQVSSLLSLSCQHLRTRVRQCRILLSMERDGRRPLRHRRIRRSAEPDHSASGRHPAISIRGVQYCSTRFIIDLPGNVHE
jgi:hypothetical protein